MRSEAEIRHEVETRLRRWVRLLLHGGLWAVGAVIVYRITLFSSFGSLTGLIVFAMFVWTVLLVLHVLRTIYNELRERMVRGAIERERQFYLLRDHYEKRKRSEDRERGEAARLHIADDGELIDYPQEEKVKADYER